MGEVFKRSNKVGILRQAIGPAIQSVRGWIFKLFTVSGFVSLLPVFLSFLATLDDRAELL